MQKVTAKEDMKENTLQYLVKMKREDLVSRSTRSLSMNLLFLKELTKLKICINDNKGVNINNEQIFLFPSTIGEKGQNCKHGTEGCREIEFDNGMRKLLDYYTRNEKEIR